MSVTPDLLLDHFVSELKAIFPSEYRIHKSYGVTEGAEDDAMMLKKRYGARINGRDLLRGWWVEWSAFQPNRQKLAQRPTHMHTFLLNGIYQIDNAQSDDMLTVAYDDVWSLTQYWEASPTFQLGGASITTIPPNSEGSARYEDNTHESELLAAFNVYNPVVSIQAFYQQVSP